MQKRDDLHILFKRMANDYIDKYGEELKAELEEMKDEPQRVTPAMDEKVKRGRAAFSRARTTRILGIVAACAVVAVVLPVMITQLSATKDVPALYARNEAAIAEQAPQSAEAPAPAAESAAAAIPEIAAAPAEVPAEAPAAAAEAPAAAAEMPESAAGGAQDMAVIPLNATLPPNFTISATGQDEGRTIYYIDNTEKDNVVLTMQYANELPDTSALKEVPINGQVAYGGYNPDYATLVFIKDGVLYELTSQYDINTLISLGESILV